VIARRRPARHNQTLPIDALERWAGNAYSLSMVETTHCTEVPAEWLEALAESEAQLAAGQTVPRDEIMRELHESIARLEANRLDKPRRRATPRR
jgi:hypothetical protein